MRIAIFALFLSFGLAAFCQTPSPAPLQPNRTWVFPPGNAQPRQDFGKLPQEFHFSFVPSQPLILPKTIEITPRFNAQMDSKIIVRPPKSGIGQQAPGTLVAQNLYPGLQLLPIDGSKAKVEPIPITWPKMKMENIPTSCPDCNMVLVESGTVTQPARK
ncbi:MAG: hypothetical protein ABR987_08250 [Terracidiphilus sp.]|jgi:hypothetical protein